MATTLEGDLPLTPLRVLLIQKLEGSEKAWGDSVGRFRALHWLCLTGLIVVPTCLASLKTYIAPGAFALLSVLVAICGSVQAIVKPADKFLRDIEFRDEANYFLRKAKATQDQAEIEKIMAEFEQVERRFHQGQHPWPVGRRDNAGKQLERHR